MRQGGAGRPGRGRQVDQSAAVASRKCAYSRLWSISGESGLEVERFVILSGCSGGGKSTLLAELGRRGYAVVEEPGRRIVREELASGGSALPWADDIAFLQRAMTMSLADRDAANAFDGWVFFDRGLIDAAAGLQYVTGRPVLEPLRTTHRYHRRVFLTPPWPEIYVTDRERRHSFEAALDGYLRSIDVYPSLGYEVSILPKVAVAERADFILDRLAA